MMTKNVTIPVPEDQSVSGVIEGPDRLNHNSRTGLVFAHGAANDMHHPSIAEVSKALAGKGFVTLRFNFPYKEKGRKSPDPEHRLVRTWQAAVRCLKKETSASMERFIAVGKSMGGRIAAQAAASRELEPDRLIFLGYPLHAPGKKDRLRDAHLYRIKVPMLFFEGTRDPFCDLDQLKKVLDKIVVPWDLELIEGGNHSFNLPGSDERSQKDVHQQIVKKCLDWL